MNLTAETADSRPVNVSMPVVEPVPEGTEAEFGQTIKAVEVFRSGTWNNEKYTNADIDEMIDAYGKAGYIPPVKLGHVDDPAAPAYGWVKNLRRDKDILLADFEDVPDDLVDLIRDGRYDAVSSEIFINMKRDGEKFPHALKAVAILGAHPPGVSSLKPLRASLASFGAAEEARSYVTTPVKQLQQERQMSVANGESGGRTGTATGNDPGNTPGDTQNHGHARAGGATVTTDAGALTVTNLDAQAATAQLQQIQAELRSLRQERDAATQMAEANANSTVRLRAFEEEVKALKAERATEKEQARQNRIRTLVESCPVPRYRRYVAAFADAMSDGTERAVKFAAIDGEEAKPIPALKVLEDFIEVLADGAKPFFGQVAPVRGYAERGDFGSEDPGTELVNKAEEYSAKNPGVDFKAALHAVRQDPKNTNLVKAYNAITKPGH